MAVHDSIRFDQDVTRDWTSPELIVINYDVKNYWIFPSIRVSLKGDTDFVCVYGSAQLDRIRTARAVTGIGFYPAQPQEV